MNAAQDLAELLERGPDPVLDARQLGEQIGPLLRNCVLDHMQLEREGDQPLLDPVVEVAFDLAAGPGAYSRAFARGSGDVRFHTAGAAINGFYMGVLTLC